MNASEYFRGLDNGLVTIVLDAPEGAPAWANLGEVTTLAEHDLLIPHDRPALVVTARLETVGQLHDHWEDSPCEFTHLSLARHDADLAAAHHAASLLRTLDADAALDRRAAGYDALLSCDSFTIASAAALLQIRCADELEIPNMSAEVRPHWLQSVTEFLEASMVNLESDGSSFTADGVFVFDGIAYLVNSGEVRDRHGAALRRLMLAAADGDNHLEIVANHVVRVIVGGVDQTALFTSLFAGDERGASVLELGLGCADITPNWSIDSPLHKCCRGAFLGVGTGYRVPHVDFVALGADVRFPGPPSA